VDPSFPNLFSLGAPKCGTTSLYRYLIQHPDVYFPFNKEPQFFCVDELYRKGLSFYLDTFFDGADRYSIKGDATPHYLYYEMVAARIAQMTKESPPKFLVILRDPVSRAYSHYWNMIKEGVETLSFEEALAAEQSRLDKFAPGSLEHLGANYVGAGMYARQLEAYLRYFPRDRFHILLQEDLKLGRETILDPIWEFLGVPRIQGVQIRMHNLAGAARLPALQRFVRQPSSFRRVLGRWLSPRMKFRFVSWLIAINTKVERYPPLDKMVASRLRMVFMEDICALEQILNRSLNHWK